MHMVISGNVCLSIIYTILEHKLWRTPPYLPWHIQVIRHRPHWWSSGPSYSPPDTCSPRSRGSATCPGSSWSHCPGWRAWSGHVNCKYRKRGQVRHWCMWFNCNCIFNCIWIQWNTVEPGHSNKMRLLSHVSADGWKKL